MTHFIAQAIADSLRNDLPAMPARILLSGRGVRNGLLWRLLEEKLSSAPLDKTDTHGIPAEARQAIACAGLALLAVDGVPGNLPSVTGASGPRLLGQFTPGSTSNWMRCLAWMSRQAAPLQAAA
jgi:anhydro-N-acetylmuramic acid kinase